MIQLTPKQVERKKLEMRIRAEAGIIRFEWLNQVLPAALLEFDRRLESGKKSTKLALPTPQELVEEALEKLGVK